MEGCTIGLDVHPDFCEVAACHAGKSRTGHGSARGQGPIREFAELTGPRSAPLQRRGGRPSQIRAIRCLYLCRETSCMTAHEVE